MTGGNCVGLHPYGPCDPGVGCNRPADPVDRRVAELEAEVAQLRGQVDAHPVGDYACTVCGGHGTVMGPGYYVPGEQFVEPPGEEPCPACAGTGGRDVQRIVARAAKLEAVAAMAREVRISGAAQHLDAPLAVLDAGTPS